MVNHTLYDLQGKKESGQGENKDKKRNKVDVRNETEGGKRGEERCYGVLGWGEDQLRDSKKDVLTTFMFQARWIIAVENEKGEGIKERIGVDGKHEIERRVIHS